jgi:MoxR-like ATPase
VLDAAQIEELFATVDRVFLPEPVAKYIARLVTASTPSNAACPERARGLIKYGASPRAAIAIGEASRAAALLAGRPNVDFDDVSRVTVPALAHRLVLDHAARLEGTTAADVVGLLLEHIDPIAEPLPGEVQ